MRKHQRVVSLRHIVPAAFIAGNLGGLALLFLLALTWPALKIGSLAAPLLVVDALYLIVLGIASAVIAARKGFRLLPILPVVFATYHLAYGSGVLAGLSYWALGFGDRKNARLFSSLTR